MKVFIDNNHCKEKDGICGSYFGGPIEMLFTGHPHQDDLRVAGCVTQIQDADIEDKITFHISRASGNTQILFVSARTWPQAHRAWMTMYLKRKDKLTA